MFLLDKESRYFLFGILVFLACYVLLGVIATRPVFSFDGYWHLQMGKDFIENGLSPWVDHYSFSYQNKEISTIPILFQILIHGFVSFFGEESGFYFIRLFYVTLLMLALFVYFKKIEANAFIVFLVLPLITYFIHIRLMLRPEIFSNVLIVLCLILYLKAQKKFGTKELVYICLLLLFWVNYHSPIMGYIIIFGLFLEKFVHKIIYNDNTFSWKFWFIWGVIIFCIGFARPGGLHFIVTVYNVIADDFGKYTHEYTESYPLFSRDIVVHVSWMLSVYVVMWSLFKKQFGFALIAVIFTYSSWSTARMMTTTTLVNLCILAHYFSHISFSHHLSNIHSSIKNILLVVAVGISILAFHSVWGEALNAIDKNNNKHQELEKRYPVQVVDYLKNFHDGGNVLNVMHVGGYLISKLSPEFRVYFDGRTNILYPIEFLEHNTTLLAKVDTLNDVVQQNNVHYAVYPNEYEVYAAFHKSEKLKLEFADKSFLLFSDSSEAVFPLSSLLMVSPTCWADDWSSSIQKEIKQSNDLFENRNYTIKHVLKLIDNYLSYEDKQLFFSELELDALQSDEVRRVALYMALGADDFESARSVYGSILEKSEYDTLIFSYYLVKAKEYREAENLLYSFYLVTRFVKNKIVAFDKIEIMVHILNVLDKEDELKQFKSSYITRLEKKLEKGGYTLDDELSFESVCN